MNWAVASALNRSGTFRARGILTLADGQGMLVFLPYNRQNEFHAAFLSPPAISEPFPRRAMAAASAPEWQ